jgi:hypothetical protein
MAVRLQQTRRLRDALLAGLFAGLGAATKYNMALVLLPLIVLGLISLRGRLISVPAANGGRMLAVAIGAAVVAFLVACPGAVLEAHRFAADLRFEAVHVSDANAPTFKDTGNGFVYQIADNLSVGLGLPLLLLAAIAVVYAAFRHERGDGLLTAFALPYYVLISLAAVRYARYVIPLLPVVAVWCGRLIADASRLKADGPRYAALGIAAVALLLTLCDCLLIVRPMAKLDNRDRALRQIDALAPPPGTVGFAVMPWFGTPPVDPYFPDPLRGGWRAMVSPQETARIVYSGKDWDIGSLQAARPDLVVLSEYDYRDALRLHDPNFERYMNVLRQQYQVRSRIVSPGVTWERDWSRGSFGLPIHHLPHDMLYTDPAIMIYQRR